MLSLQQCEKYQHILRTPVKRDIILTNLYVWIFVNLSCYWVISSIKLDYCILVNLKAFQLLFRSRRLKESRADSVYCWCRNRCHRAGASSSSSCSASLDLCPHLFLCLRFSDEAAAEDFSSPWPAAQAAQQPRRQPVLQPAKCEFKVPIKAFVWVWFRMIIQLNLPVPDPRAPPPHSSASCLEHVLMLFICCFHVRMSAFTVNNWCGLSKPSKMHASSDSLEPFDQKKIMLWLLILSASARIQHKITLN